MIKTDIENIKKFFNSNTTKSYSYRVAMLDKLSSVVKQYESEIIDALSDDLGKSETEAYITEIAAIKSEIKYYKNNLKKFMKPESVSTNKTIFPAKSYIIREPKGVVLIISPWNYPFFLSLSPLVLAIATGNCAVIKPSEITEKSTLLIEKMINESFDNNYIKVISGGIEATNELLENRFDHIFFTGSTTVGRIIMQKAANHLTPVTLELGGKSPVIVDHTADIKLAAKRIIWGKLLNAGQTCIAPDYVYAHMSIKDELIKAMISTIHTFYSENPIEHIDYQRVVNERHFNRIISLIKKENVVYGGNYDINTLKIEPTIIDNVTLDDKVMQDEIFAPILPILPYNDLTEVISNIKNGEKPLSLYIFTDDETTKKRITQEISFGGGTINDTLQHLLNDNLPFGGVGNSGTGKYHGRFGFDELSNLKSIVDKSKKLDIFLRYPPYKGKLKLLKLFLK